MEQKILFLDLDGTLLSDEKEITPGSRRAIQEALARGHRVVICSGRPLASVLEQAESLKLTGAGCYAIAFNGGVIYDCARRREVCRRTLALEDTFALFDEARRRGLHIQTYDGDEVVVDRLGDDELVREYCGVTHMALRVVENIRTALDAPTVKTLVISRDRTALEAMQGWVTERMGGRVGCFFSSRTFLEEVPAGTDKGEAVRTLCGMLGIPLERAVAAGDEANDIPMLTAAGVGAAMKNAAAQVKAAADYVTGRDNNHDGVAEIVEKFFL